MTTERQKQAARTNGAKSRGPVTAEGKARSSKNATTHGLTAESVVLPGESEQRFHALLDSMLEAYAPSSDYEVSLVEKMAALNWQQDRLLSIDTVTLGVQMDVMAPALEAEVENLSTPTLIALAYRDLSDHSRVLPNLDRHASRIRRQFNQIRTELLALQKTRKTPDTDPLLARREPHPAPVDETVNTRLQNEPTSDQPSANQQCTNPETAPGTAVTGSAPHTPSADHTSSHSDSRLPSPDFSLKLQNEPTSKQPSENQQRTNPEMAPGTSRRGSDV